MSVTPIIFEGDRVEAVWAPSCFLGEGSIYVGGERSRFGRALAASAPRRRRRHRSSTLFTSPSSENTPRH